MIDRLNMIISGLKNAVNLTVENVLARLKEMKVEVTEEDTAGDWGGWSVISKAIDVGILNLSDADINAMYYVFRRCATLEEMVKEHC
ncbi:hypothetical protein [Vulcanisaeta souniana]|uniref:hypothetical protein n=1 Tax=Vulcanisaeta souniana TaxID=164452 RepID=UPI000A5621D2|nr:hypothetical protein [Vulcanisaeta souniana]